MSSRTTSTHNYARARRFFGKHVLEDATGGVDADVIASHYGIKARRDNLTLKDAPDPANFAYTQEYVDLGDQLNRYADQEDAAREAYYRQLERITADASEYRP